MRCYVSYRYAGNKEKDIRPKYSWIIAEMANEGEYMTDEYFRGLLKCITEVTCEEYNLEEDEVSDGDFVLLNITRMERDW